jgi:hypothetical protein
VQRAPVATGARRHAAALAPRRQPDASTQAASRATCQGGADALYEAPTGSWPFYSAGMNRRAHLIKELKEAERELEATSRLCDVRAAAKKLNRARIELQWLDDEENPKRRRPSRGRAPGGASA